MTWQSCLSLLALLWVTWPCLSRWLAPQSIIIKFYSPPQYIYTLLSTKPNLTGQCQADKWIGGYENIFQFVRIHNKSGYLQRRLYFANVSRPTGKMGEKMAVTPMEARNLATHYETIFCIQGNHNCSVFLVSSVPDPTLSQYICELRMRGNSTPAPPLSKDCISLFTSCCFVTELKPWHFVYEKSCSVIGY